MNSKPIFAAALSALVLSLGGMTLADAKSITLPMEAPPLKASPLPGYAKAQTNCVACHSAEYMLYQPPTAPRAYC
jgi:mono/diheme cytochrome c family protein